jgi:hypothetical protein
MEVGLSRHVFLLRLMAEQFGLLLSQFVLRIKYEEEIDSLHCFPPQLTPINLVLPVYEWAVMLFLH